MAKERKQNNVNARLLNYWAVKDAEINLAGKVKPLKGKEQKAVGGATDERNMDRWYESDSN